MSCGECQLDADAGEFVPSNPTEKIQAEELVRVIISRAFDLNAEVSETAFLKACRVYLLYTGTNNELGLFIRK